MTPWLDIIGCGEGALPPIPPVETIVAPRRIIARLREANSAPGARLSEWRSLETADMVAQITALRGTPTALLASGDPLWFGIGATLRRHLAPDEFSVTPHASSFQYAAARMRWPLQNVVMLSAHARPPEVIHPHVLPGNRILALTSDATTAARIAALLVARGYGGSLLTAMENLGGPAETITSSPARSFAAAIGDFYVLAIDCVADTGAPLLPPLPGLPDEVFAHDGQLTKREVRAATLARLAPYPAALLWDVGAGSGSIGIEWMRAARDAKAIAFERDESRCERIAANRRALGVPQLTIIEGEAPGSFERQPAPDAVFVGGGLTDAGVFEACWTALKPGGCLVANAVTVAAEAATLALAARHGGELIRIAVSRLEEVGGERAFRPRLPVTQWAVRK